MKKILVLCPLKKELENIKLKLEEKGFKSKEEKAGPLSLYHFPDLGMHLSQAGHGKTQFGIQTQFLIQHFKKVDAVICAGAGGSISDEVQAFDVVAASKTIEHDYQLKFIQRPLPEFPGDEKMLSKLRSEKVSGFKVSIGPVASGDEDIIDAVRASEIKKSTNAVAVAWEGAGGARAALFNNIPFLEIRGITDRADGNAPTNFSANLQQAMAHIAECLVFLARP
jgi:adenosylhomocysteine nucleosidase